MQQGEHLFVSFSGGLDSTATLIWACRLAKKRGGKVTPVSVDLKREVRSQNEKKARSNIIEELKKSYSEVLNEPLQIQVDCSSLKVPRSRNYFQLPFYFSFIYPFLPDGAVLMFGYHEGINPHLFITEFQKTVSLFNKMYGKDVRLFLPHLETPKYKNYLYVKKHKMLDMIVYCDNSASTPCMNCPSCYAHTKAEMEASLKKRFILKKLKSR